MLTYLIVIWIILTLSRVGSGKHIRQSGAVFILWFLLTMAVAYPVVQWASHNEYIGTVAANIRSDFRAESAGNWSPGEWGKWGGK